MTRSNLNLELVALERTLRLIRTSRRRLFDIGCVEDNSVHNSPNYVSVSIFEFANNSVFVENMANRTLKELAALDVNYQALAIQYPDLDADFELKSRLIHLLPKFHGLAGEDPHKHLKEFHVCVQP